MKSKKINLNTHALILVIIFLIALFFRLYKFNTIPLGLNHDGAQDALQAIQLLQKPWPPTIYFDGGSGEVLFKYYLAGFIGTLGTAPWVIKLASTLLSFLTVITFYFFAKKTIGKIPATFGTFLLAISGWHIVMGKTVWRVISFPPLLIITLYFLMCGIQENKYRYFALSGLFLGLTLHTYNAARITPLYVGIVLFVAIILKLKKHKLQAHDAIIHVLLLVYAFLIFFTPLAIYAMTHWGEFNARLNATSVISRIKEEKNYQPIIENSKNSLLLFNKRGNGNDFFIDQPLLDQPTAALFILGFLVALLRMKKKPIYAFILLGLFVYLLPGFLSIPNGNRNMGTLPFVYILSGVGLYTIYTGLKTIFKNKYSFLSYCVIIAFSISGIYITYTKYFGKNRREIWGFYPETTIVGQYIKPRLNQYNFYITDNYPRDALTYLTYLEGDPWEKNYTWYDKKEDFLNVIPGKKGIIFIMFDSDENKDFITKLENQFPGGSASRIFYKNGDIESIAGLTYTLNYIDYR